MSQQDPTSQRRKLLKMSIAGAFTPALIRVVPVWADDPVDENDATAKQFAYVHDATTATDPKYVAEQLCNNCQLYQGAAGDEWGACPLFQGKLVNAKGWCNAWVPKPG